MFIRKIFTKVSGSALIFFGIFLFLAIASYSPNDNSFNKISNTTEVKNFAGNWGAYIADPFIQSLGIASILPIIFFTVLGFKMVLKKEVKLIVLRFCLLFIISPMLALSLAIIANALSMNNDMGGVIGTFLLNELKLRADLKTIATFAFPVSVLGSIICFNLSFSELLKLLSFIARKIVFAALVAAWALKFCYAISKKLIQRIKKRDFENIAEDFSREAIEEELGQEDKRIEPFIEIVSKARVSESKVKIQSKLKLEPDEFELPSILLLKEHVDKNKKVQYSEAALSQNSKLLQKVLEDFGVTGNVQKIHPGPVVTLYEFEPSAGTKSSRVIGLSDDIARSMSAISARIAVIPGKSSLGIELPNAHRELVSLRELVESKMYQGFDDKLPLVLGKNIAGEPVIADLAKMPHLLVAGTTGSGKSVAINTMILSLLYKFSPKQCRFIMIDPKMLELSIYDNIPHLLAPVVTEPKKAISALKWVVKEMENRYRNMSLLGVRNLEGYNKALLEAQKTGQKLEKQVQVGFDPQTGKPTFETITMDTEPMPFIVVIVDEMADLMLVAGKEIEGSIQRLAQMARAAGIHLIMATQRPSVDVITGVIKANFPTRISFQVTSKIDSRTILGEQGAEQLLGMGDMLFMRGGGRIERVHGPFVSDAEVEAITKFLKAQATPSYVTNITVDESSDEADLSGEFGSGEDDMYNQAVQIVIRERKASTSYIQRCLRIGYNRAANLIERMEREGIVSAPNHVGKREILKGNAE